MKTILVRTIRKAALALAVALLTTAVASRALAAQTFLYTQTNLTSNLPNQAANQDPNLQNAWGVAFCRVPFSPVAVHSGSVTITPVCRHSMMPRERWLPRQSTFRVRPA
jgi:hypothetical protein